MIINQNKEKEAEFTSEGVAFSFVRKCPHLSEKEIEDLKKIVKGYLTEGKRYDKDYTQWYELKNWT